MSRTIFSILAFVAITALALYAYSEYFSDTAETIIPPENGTPIDVPIVDKIPEVVAEDLNIPWDIVFLGDEGLLVTERPGTLLLIDSNGLRKSLLIPDATHRGEGGLLGAVLHPDFASNRLLYLYHTYESAGGLSNRVVRYRFEDGVLSEPQMIIEGIPGASYHDGGRIEFGPDRLLYITTGDAGRPALAQDRNSLAGKILRLNDDGTIPEGNPFGTAVYSYGHRNSQGLAWDRNGRLWSTEHGRSGAQSGLDEINRIASGENFGWPENEGDATSLGMTGPMLHSGNVTWAPASLAHLGETLYFGGLRGEALYSANLENGEVTDLARHFHQEFGRIRTVRIGPDGMLYLLTSNRDGRGLENEGDDKIIRVDPASLE